MTVLDQICAAKQDHISAMKAQTPLAALEEKIKNQPPARGFHHALKTKGAPALIAEVKKASPSKGIIREDFDPVEIAKIYESSGAACLSVLTDEPYFQGKDEYLTAVRAAVKLPVLRKDFMLDPYQVFESRALGADCVLLIMAALGDETAKELHDLARALTMDVLVEVHDEDELTRALALNPTMIGINNRNLKTLEVDIKTSETLATKIPDNILKIAESGISTNEQITHLTTQNFTAFLIGESLMREADIGAAVHKLLNTHAVRNKPKDHE